MTKDKIQDFTCRVASANKTEMIVILYDIATTYIKDSISDLEKADYSSFRSNVSRIRNTIRELMNSVDTSVEIGHNLLKLYIFCSTEITKAYLDYDRDCLYHVLSIIGKLREAYEEISKKDTSGPVMQNAETVYNGFTYNRNLRSENVADRDLNRGILV